MRGATILPIMAMLAAGVSACAPPSPYNASPYAALSNESQARAGRFMQLSAMQGLPPPSVTNVMAQTGYGVPVTVVVFDERDVFASGSANPGPAAGRMFDVVAEAMRQDGPGAQLTLLGHTDAVGTDPANDTLSLRRAQAVLGALQARGIPGIQLSTVAIGRRQPIAPNAMAEGRARNRRVEFLLSNSGDANLDVIANRPVQLAFLSLGAGAARPAPSTNVSVLRPAAPATGGASDVSEAPLQKSRDLVLRPAS